MEVWGKGSRNWKGPGLFQAKGSFCLIIKDEAAHPPPALPATSPLLGRPLRSPTATLDHFSEPLDLDLETTRALANPC